MASGDPAQPGDVIAGKYRIDRVIGRGAMGVVLGAVDLASRAPRAIKLMSPAALAHAGAVERFLREARATAALRSEHVARVHDVGRLDDGAPFLVLEHLDGEDLGAALKRRGALPAHEAIGYVLDACDALAEAHAAGIVHRDLKPANLFLARREGAHPCVKVIDFGLSKELVPPHGHELTQTDTVLGSPYYMSPEQIASARDVDARTDIWALGVILYQLITGKVPFPGDSAAEVVAKAIRQAPVPPSKQRVGLPLALDGVVLRCLEKRAEARYASVQELAAALRPFVPHGADLPKPGPSVRPGPMTAGDDSDEDTTHAMPSKARPPRSAAPPDALEIPGAPRSHLRDPLWIGAFFGAFAVAMAIGILILRSNARPASAPASSAAVTATAGATAEVPPPPALTEEPTSPTTSASLPASAAIPAKAPRAVRPSKAPGPSPTRGSDIVDPFAKH